MKWLTDNTSKRLGVVLLIGLGLLTAGAPALAQETVVGTVYQTTNLRGGPGTRFEIVGQLVEGDQVSVIGRAADGRWLLITADTDLEGWLPVFSLLIEMDIMALAIIDPNDPRTPVAVGGDVFIESYGQVNVRSGPGISYAIVAQLDVGERAEAQARNNRDNDWLFVILEDDTEGWVAFFTVKVTGDTTELPVLTVDATGEVLVPPSALARTRFNIRLHDDPALESPISAIIPFGRMVTPIARTEDGTWMLVAYEEVEGWGAADLFALDSEIFDDLPVQESVE